MALDTINRLSATTKLYVDGVFPTTRRLAQYFLVSLLTALAIRYFVFDTDPYRCQAVAKSGQWFDYPPVGKAGNIWLTPGCHNIYHGNGEIQACANGKDRKIVFAGDLQLKSVYWSIAHRLDKDIKTNFDEKDESIGRDQVRIEYIWDPHLNGSTLSHVEDFRDGTPDRPLLLVVGAGNYAIKHDMVDEYALTVKSLASTAYQSLPHSPIGSTISNLDGPGDLLLFAPTTVPYRNSENNATGISVHEKLNARLAELDSQNILDVMWSFDALSHGRKDMFADDGISPVGEVAKRQADLLLNLRCNARVANRGNFPHLATCCAKWRQPNWTQSTFLLLGLCILPLVVAVDFTRPILSEECRQVVRGFSAFTAGVSIQWLADRTHMFEQVARLKLVPSNLRNMIIATIVIGAAMVRRCKSNRKPPPGEREPDQPFLPRDQTDEWKGWMQALIIIYHYNMAWTNNEFWSIIRLCVASYLFLTGFGHTVFFLQKKEDVEFWSIIRLCVASYLFLTGFGHTVFFLQKKDYSLKRFVNVMIRTNLLPVSLAYVMRTRWLLYYYMPLSTFWFTVIYLTLAVGKKYNEHTWALLAKIAASAWAVHTFVTTKDLAGTVVRLFAIVFKISFDADAFFHHRVAQDQYIVYIGMLVAMFYIWSKDVLTTDRRQDRASRVFRRAWPFVKFATIGISAISFAHFFYWSFAGISQNGQSWFNKQQPYYSFVPILAFAVLRNAHPVLRNYFSASFAFLGRCSGEMYVMQNHLWLAGDQEAVLRTGFFHGDESVGRDRWRDLVLLTPLYLIVCSMIGDATGVIANWFVKEAEERKQAMVPEVELGLLSENDDANLPVVNEKDTPRWRWMGTASCLSVWPLTLKDRVLLVLAIMWLLNLTYT